MNGEERSKGFRALRVAFDEDKIGKLPKHKKDAKKGKCEGRANSGFGGDGYHCGGYHGLPAAHLDYVGHAAVTDRLLSVDPEWNWEPVATDGAGLPMLDKDNGLWINLTVLGVTRLGYGTAAASGFKSKGDLIKELVGDAIRNAAMRFGVALDQWFKDGELHSDDGPNMPSVTGLGAPFPTTPPPSVNTNGHSFDSDEQKDAWSHLLGLLKKFPRPDHDQILQGVEPNNTVEEIGAAYIRAKEYNQKVLPRIEKARIDFKRVGERLGDKEAIANALTIPEADMVLSDWKAATDALLATSKSEATKATPEAEQSASMPQIMAEIKSITEQVGADHLVSAKAEAGVSGGAGMTRDQAIEVLNTLKGVACI